MKEKVFSIQPFYFFWFFFHSDGIGDGRGSLRFIKMSHIESTIQRIVFTSFLQIANEMQRNKLRYCVGLSRNIFIDEKVWRIEIERRQINGYFDIKPI